MAGRLNEGDDSERVLATEGEQVVDVTARPRFCIVSSLLVHCPFSGCCASNSRMHLDEYTESMDAETLIVRQACSKHIDAETILGASSR